MAKCVIFHQIFSNRRYGLRKFKAIGIYRECVIDDSLDDRVWHVQHKLIETELMKLNGEHS